MNLSLWNSNGIKIYPRYYSEKDLFWIQPLVELFDQHTGRSYRDLRIAIFEYDNENWSGTRFDFILKSLEQKFKFIPPKLELTPKIIRQKLFESHEISCKISNGYSDTKKTINQFSRANKIHTKTVESLLYADLPDEKVISKPNQTISIDEFISEANFGLAQKLLSHSKVISIQLLGNSLKVIRQAKWNGLLCSVAKSDPAHGFSLKISGPLSLLRRTKYYQGRIKSLMPSLMETENFQLRATVELGAMNRVLYLSKSDPIKARANEKKFDSKIETKFYEQFLRATDNWLLIREPKPLKVEEGLIFPDFLIRHKTIDSSFIYLEIIGFWTAEYLEKKFSDYLSICDPSKVILCIKESVSDPEFEKKFPGAIFKFKTRINVNDILKFLEN